jgi:nucleotide-binding universal stress UspA family protein
MKASAPWKPIIVGLDGSREASQAATFAYHLAAAAGTTCHVVHAAPDPWMAGTTTARPELAVQYQGALEERARAELLERLRGTSIAEAGRDLLVRFGRPVRVLQQLIDEVGAELVVLGGKRHAALERWFGGTTALNAVRALAVPVLVLRHPPPRFERVLAAVDVSAAAGPTIAAAERLAAVFGASVRVISAVEPVPATLQGPPTDATAYYALWEDLLRREVWPLIRAEGAQGVVRHGPAAEAIEHDAAAWPADLLVVGSHGKGWVDRLMLGTLTERLLNRLPTSLLVVPVARAVEAAADQTESAGAAPG